MGWKGHIEKRRSELVKIKIWTARRELVRKWIKI